MSNFARGQVPVEALGETYTLSFSLNALCRMEDYFEESVADTMERFAGLEEQGKSLPMKSVRAFVWCALTDFHGAMTEEDAGRLVTDIGLQEAVRLVMTAFEKAQDPTAAGAAPAGKASGARAEKAAATGSDAGNAKGAAAG